MKRILFFLLALIASTAFAQTSPGLVNGQIPNAAAWNSYFAAKLDYQPTGSYPSITGLGTVTSGIWNAAVIGSSYGGAGNTSGALKADGGGNVSQASCGDLADATALCSTPSGTGVATAIGTDIGSDGGVMVKGTSTCGDLSDAGNGCSGTLPVAANPTGTAGLAAVNGSAATFMRSDGAPALAHGVFAVGTQALGTTAVAYATCNLVTAAATGVLTTDVLTASFNVDPTGTTGYVPATTGMLTIIPYPTAGNVNFKICNNTASSITPGASLTLNWVDQR